MLKIFNKKNRILVWIFSLMILAGLVFVAQAVKEKFFDKPKISVIIPVYNAEPFLKECLDSVLDQTYENVEIVCVNDGSKDNSLSILNEYKEKHDNIIVIDQPNGGVSSARNAGIRASSGKYLQFLDSDDLLAPKTCESLCRAAQVYNADIVRFKYTYFKDGETPDVSKELEYGLYNLEHYNHQETENPFLTNSDYNISCNKVWKKSFLIDNNLFFDERVRLGEDSLFSFMAFIRTNTVVIDKNTYYYYRKGNSQSAMSSATNKKWFDNRLKMIRHMVEHKQDFKFSGYGEWILSWALSYTREYIFDLETDEEKTQYAKTLFEIIDEPLLKDEKLNISKENRELLQTLREMANASS